MNCFFFFNTWLLSWSRQYYRQSLMILWVLGMQNHVLWQNSSGLGQSSNVAMLLLTSNLKISFPECHWLYFQVSAVTCVYQFTLLNHIDGCFPVPEPDFQIDVSWENFIKMWTQLAFDISAWFWDSFVLGLSAVVSSCTRSYPGGLLDASIWALDVLESMYASPVCYHSWLRVGAGNKQILGAKEIVEG